MCVNRKSRVIPRLGHAGNLKAYSRVNWVSVRHLADMSVSVICQQFKAVIGTMGTCDMTLVVDND